MSIGNPGIMGWGLILGSLWGMHSNRKDEEIDLYEIDIDALENLLAKAKAVQKPKLYDWDRAQREISPSLINRVINIFGKDNELIDLLFREIPSFNKMTINQWERLLRKIV